MTEALPLAHHKAVTLEDRYQAQAGQVLASGPQALIRLMLVQGWRDKAMGIKTSGFVSGYRGSPLGGLDQQLWKAQKFLQANQIIFQPGLNEDLAAAALWGTQQLALKPADQHQDIQGVYGMWYGKAPGVDRTGDVFRHANLAGTSRYGGVLAIAGDDPGAKSSTVASQTDYAFVDSMLPLLSPSGVAEFIHYGLLGFALSRFSGLWVALKSVTDTIETTSVIPADEVEFPIPLPQDFAMPHTGVHIRWPHSALEQEKLLHEVKLPAALHFARSLQINRLIFPAANSHQATPLRIGIITSGKSYLDVRQALDDLGIGTEEAQKLGLGLYKIGMIWPLEMHGLTEFAYALEECLVVEEKRPLIEDQFKANIFAMPAGARPRVVGKFDENHRPLFPSYGELTPSLVAKIIYQRLLNLSDGPQRLAQFPHIAERVAFLTHKQSHLQTYQAAGQRLPYFCAGCPHNSSTKLPEGSEAMAGIGCHFMATWMNRDTATFSVMGGEGASWIGQSPFNQGQHIFANLGDGTYVHSGLLAIRASIAAKVNLTYKLLYNDAVAMTGGQPAEGTPSVPAIAWQLWAEGVSSIIITSDEPEKYDMLLATSLSGKAESGRHNSLPPSTIVYHRRELDRAMKELREIKGVSLLIHDQTCAAEKRRRRKRGKLADPPVRAFINHRVCEACGDCSVQSNCVAVAPRATLYGQKRQIDQTACNRDFTCTDGFCPSFALLELPTEDKTEEATKRASQAKQAKQQTLAKVREELWQRLPTPSYRYSWQAESKGEAQPWNIVITGVGGTGVITLGALLAMAAHCDGRAATAMDMTGLAQKNGPVFSHVRIAPHPQDIHASRISAGGADFLLAGDLVVAASFDALSKTEARRTRALVNGDEINGGELALNRDWFLPAHALGTAITQEIGADHCQFVKARGLLSAYAKAQGLADNNGKSWLSDQQANLFLLGLAWAMGEIPLSAMALSRAIELNETQIEENKIAFACGALAVNPANLPQTEEVNIQPATLSFEAWRQKMEAELRLYQPSAGYDKLWREAVTVASQTEARLGQPAGSFAQEFGQVYFRFLAVKDEYEVARLWRLPDIHQEIRHSFGASARLYFSLSLPWTRHKLNSQGRPPKQLLGANLLWLFGLLSHWRHYRHSWLDPLRFGHEAKLAQEIRHAFETHCLTPLPQLKDEAGLQAWQARLADFEKIRGYGPIKAKAWAALKPKLG